MGLLGPCYGSNQAAPVASLNLLHRRGPDDRAVHQDSDEIARDEQGNGIHNGCEVNCVIPAVFWRGAPVRRHIDTPKLNAINRTCIMVTPPWVAAASLWQPYHSR